MRGEDDGDIDSSQGVGGEQTRPVGQFAGSYSEGREVGAVVWWVLGWVPLCCVGCPPSWLVPPEPPDPPDSLLVSHADSVSTETQDSVARRPAAERRDRGADTGASG